MSQNLLSIALSDEGIAAINTALGDIESRLTGLVALDNDARRALTKMGDKSEAFVRQTMLVLEQNPDIVPASIGLPEAVGDLRALDQLRPVAARRAMVKIRPPSQRSCTGGQPNGIMRRVWCFARLTKSSSAGAPRSALGLLSAER